MNRLIKNNDYFIGLHAFLAIVFTVAKPLVLPYILVIFAYGTLRILQTRDKNNAAGLFAAYIVGIEVFLRMTKAAPLHEFGKYSISALLFLGLLVRSRSNKKSLVFLVYFLLLAFSIPQTLTSVSDISEARGKISFNLSGPLTLTMAALYFYKTPINYEKLNRIIVNILAPILLTTIYVILNTKALSEIEFGPYSMAETSLFGSNQLSTLLGSGILLSLLIMVIPGLNPFRYKFIPPLLLAIFALRGLLTFSRGGMLVPLIAFGVAIILTPKNTRRTGLKLNRIIFFMGFVGVVVFGIWKYVDAATGNMLTYRYQGKTTAEIYHNKKMDHNTFQARGEILSFELDLFTQKPLFGVGPGMTDFYRRRQLGVKAELGAAAHTEYTRMLAEHGIFGFGALLIILLTPFLFFLINAKGIEKMIFICFFGLAMMTFGHSAMRLALPCVFFGLSMMKLREANQPFFRFQKAYLS